MRFIGRTIWHEQTNFVPLDASRAWTFADMTTEGWWDASDLSTITDTSGEVTQLADKSGNLQHLTQTIGFGPMTGTYTLNDLNMMYFDGSEALGTYGDNFVVPASGNFAVLQVSEVFLPLSNTADGLFSMLDAGVGGPDWQFVGGVNVSNFNGRIVANELGGVNTNFSPAMGIGGGVYGMEFNFTDSTIRGSITGNDVGGTDYTIKPASTQTFLVNSNRVGNALAGHTGETVIFEDLSKMEIAVASLAWKWGFPHQLPESNPWKYIRP